jgi:DNA-binding NtrC family response regulator
MVNSPHPSSVLVVDDELLIRWALREALEAKGYVVTEAADAASVRRALGNQGAPPDVIVLDYRLPDSNDLALLGAIRREVPQTLVIMMTAFGTPEMLQGALDLGTYRVVNKPFEVQQMVDLIGVALDAARLKLER